jgi:DNA-damage-inducible protein J
MKMANLKSNLNVRIDSNVKELASQLLSRMGIDQTTAIDMFFRQIIAEQRLPFQPIVGPTLDEQLVSALEMHKTTEYTLDTDKNGNLLIDKELHPDLYDGAVNG